MPGAWDQQEHGLRRALARRHSKHPHRNAGCHPNGRLAALAGHGVGRCLSLRNGGRPMSTDLHDVAERLAASALDLVTELMGAPPNRRMSNGRKARWGTHGSLAVE